MALRRPQQIVAPTIVGTAPKRSTDYWPDAGSARGTDGAVSLAAAFRCTRIRGGYNIVVARESRGLVCAVRVRPSSRFVPSSFFPARIWFPHQGPRCS